MKFKDKIYIESILEETSYGDVKPRHKVISVDETKELLATKCSDAYKNFIQYNRRIFRGVESASVNTLFIDPSKHTRISRNTKNFYTLIVDNSPRWDKYPKRSKSIICSSDEDGADGYGTLYLVFPFDDANIGVCPRGDFWVSFREGFGNTDISFLNDCIDYLGSLYSKHKDNILDYDNTMTYNELLSVFNIFDNNKNELKEKMDNNKSRMYSYYKETLAPYLNSNVKFIDFAEKILDPATNKFSTTTPKEYRVPSSREVWTDSPSVLIKLSDINYFQYAEITIH